MIVNERGWRVRFFIRGPKASMTVLTYDHEPSDTELQNDLVKLRAESYTAFPPYGFHRT